MMNRNLKQTLYIFWLKEANKVHVDAEQFVNKVNELKEQGRTEIDYSSRTINYYNFKTYSIREIGKYMYLYFVVKNEGPQMYIVNSKDPTKNTKNHLKGSECIEMFEDKFKEQSSTTLIKAFGTVDETFKRNICKGFYYVKYGSQYSYCASSIDASSQYPSGLYGLLPDSHTQIKVEGRVKPTADYPFAYYSSGHIAIYNEFDSHDWLSHKLSPYLFRLKGDYQLLNNDDYTILMKPSKYTLNDVWQYFFDNRAEHPEYKDVMNETIGMMHTNYYKTRKFAHLAAIAIARGNNKILKMVDKIGVNNILHICVDGIIYEGNKVYGIEEKLIGQFKQEFVDCVIRINGANSYIAMKDGKVVKYKHGATNKYSDTLLDIDEQGVTSFEDMDKWIKVDPLQNYRK